MNTRELYNNWISIVSIGILLFGIMMAFFVEPTIFPVEHSIIAKLILSVLGATMIGWAITILFVARYAFAHRVPYLLKIILASLVVWYIIDTLLSAYFEAYFNVVLNSIILIAAAIPLIVGQRVLRESV